MAVISSVRATYQPLRYLPFDEFVNLEFMRVDTPFDQPPRMLQIDNLTNQNVLISFDGVTTHTIVTRQGSWVHDYCSNQALAGGGLLELPAGPGVYVMGADDNLLPVAPTTGALCVTVIYADSH